MRKYFQVILLAIADYRREKLLSFCSILGLAAVLAPLLLLYGVKFGVMQTLTDRILSNPTTLEISPIASGHFTNEDFDRFRNNPDIAFVLPRTRSIAATMRLTAAGDNPAHVTVSLEPTAAGDPLLARYGAQSVTMVPYEEKKKESPAAGKSPAQAKPAPETPAKEAPAQATPDKETPDRDTPAQAKPAPEKPAKETPAQATPAQKTSDGDAPAQTNQAPETPDGDTPALAALALLTPVQNIPEQAASARVTPVQTISALAIPARQIPAQNISALVASAQKTPAQKTHARTASSQKAPALKSSTRTASTQKTPPQKASARAASAQKTHAPKSSARTASGSKPSAQKSSTRTASTQKTPPQKASAQAAEAQQKPVKETSAQPALILPESDPTAPSQPTSAQETSPEPAPIPPVSVPATPPQPTQSHIQLTRRPDLNSPALREAGAVLSDSAARKLGVHKEDIVLGVVERANAGVVSRAYVRLRIHAVLPLAAQQKDTVYVPLELIESCEDFRDGRAVPELGEENGWTGEPKPTEPRIYPSFRLYAKTLQGVGTLRDSFAAKGVETYTKAEEIEQIITLDNGLNLIFSIICLAAAAGFFFSTTTSVLAGIKRKQRTLGLLQLMGFSTGSLMLFPLVQVTMTAVWGSAFASGAYILLAHRLNQHFSGSLQGLEQVCRLLPEHFALAVALTAGLSLLAALPPALHSTKIEPSEVIRDV